MQQRYHHIQVNTPWRSLEIGVTFLMRLHAGSNSGICNLSIGWNYLARNESYRAGTHLYSCPYALC